MGQRSLKIIQTNTIRKLGCCFLFAFHSNYGSILHRQNEILVENRDFFHTTLAFDAPVRGGDSRRIIAIPFGVEKLDWSGYLKVKKFENMVSGVNRIPACDRRTDIVRRHSPRYAYASRHTNQTSWQWDMVYSLLTTQLLYSYLNQNHSVSTASTLTAADDLLYVMSQLPNRRVTQWRSRETLNWRVEVASNATVEIVAHI